MMDKEELTALLDRISTGGDDAMPGVSAEIADKVGLYPLADALRNLEGTIQDMGFSASSVHMLRMGIARVGMGAIMLHEMRKREAGDQATRSLESLRNAQEAWVGICSKNEYTQFMVALLASLIAFGPNEGRED